MKKKTNKPEWFDLKKYSNLKRYPVLKNSPPPKDSELLPWIHNLLTRSLIISKLEQNIPLNKIELDFITQFQEKGFIAYQHKEPYKAKNIHSLTIGDMFWSSPSGHFL